MHGRNNGSEQGCVGQIDAVSVCVLSLNPCFWHWPAVAAVPVPGACVRWACLLHCHTECIATLEFTCAACVDGITAPASPAYGTHSLQGCCRSVHGNVCYFARGTQQALLRLAVSWRCAMLITKQWRCCMSGDYTLTLAVSLQYMFVCCCWLGPSVAYSILPNRTLWRSRACCVCMCMQAVCWQLCLLAVACCPMQHINLSPPAQRAGCASMHSPASKHLCFPCESTLQSTLPAHQLFVLRVCLA
jgi:hypothetical protein